MKNQIPSFGKLKKDALRELKSLEEGFDVDKVIGDVEGFDAKEFVESITPDPASQWIVG